MSARRITRIDFRPAFEIAEHDRQARITYLSEVLRSFKSSRKRVKNLKQLRAEAAALDISWTASYELHAAYARLKLAQADYDAAYDRAVARVDEYLRVRLERFASMPKVVGHT